MTQKRDKKRWLFRKPAHFHAQQNDQTKSGAKANDDIVETKDVISTPAVAVGAAEQRHAIAVAAATAVAAEAAAATAQAAVEIVRLTRHKGFHREQYYAAVVIQTAFRGYLVSSGPSYLH